MTQKEPSLTDQVLALLRGGAMMSASQVAMRIKHDPAKTRQLLYNLVSDGRITKAGMLEGETAYRIEGSASTASSMEDLAEQQLTPPTPPTIDDLPSSSLPAASTKAKRTSSARKTPAAAAPARQQARNNAPFNLGILDTGELCVLLHGQPPVVATLDQTNALRRLLQAGATT